LTGKNIINEPLFICKRCGSNYVGHRLGNVQSKVYYKYICSNYHKIGNIACGDPFYLEKDFIEKLIIEEICSRYENIENIDKLAQEILTGEKQKGTEIKTNLKNVDAECKIPPALNH
jgi:hypothetical protein